MTTQSSGMKTAHFVILKKTGVKMETSMKKAILFVLAMVPSLSLAEQFQISRKIFVKLDGASAEKYQLDLPAILRATAPKDMNNIFIELNENNQILDISIFDEKVFNEPRLDWRM